jgi:hypothetical protein
MAPPTERFTAGRRPSSSRGPWARRPAIALHAAHADSAPLIAIVGRTGLPAGEASMRSTPWPFGGLCRWACEVRDVALPGR